MAGMVVGEAGDTGTGGNGNGGEAGMTSKGGSSGSSAGTSTGGTGDTGSSATGGSSGVSSGKGGTGGSGNTGNEGGSGNDSGTGGSTSGSGGSSMAGMAGSSVAGAGTGGTNAGTGGDSGSSGTGGSTGGTTGGSAGASGTGGSMGGTGGSTGGTTGGSAGAGATGGTTGGSSGAGASGGAAGGPSCTIGDICRAASGECDQPEFYDSECNCPTDLLKSDGSACGSASSSNCDDPDTCQAGACQPNHKSPDTFCGGQDVSHCRADACDGNGTCVPDQPAFAGQTCGTVSCTAGVVTGVGSCDGINTGCTQYASVCYGPCNAGNTNCQYLAIQQVSTTTTTGIGPIANNSDNIYWSTSTGIIRISKNDWSNVSTYSTSSAAIAMIGTDTGVFFSDNGGVHCMTTTGGTVQNIHASKPMKFATDGTNVFWSDYNVAQTADKTVKNKLWSSSATCNSSTSTTVRSFLNGGGWLLPSLAITGDSVYFQEIDFDSVTKNPYSVFNQIEKCSSGNCNPTGEATMWNNNLFGALFNNLGSTSYVWTAGINVYFVGQTNATSNLIWKEPLANPMSDNPSPIYTNTIGSAGDSQWTAGPNYVYMGNQRLSLAGGSSMSPITVTTKWAAHYYPLSAETGDVDSVYFTSTGYYTDLAHAEAYGGIGDTTYTAVKGLYVHPMD